MQWSEIAPDTWMPFDLQKREIHHCWKKNPRNLIMRPVTDEQGRRELREIYDAISVEDGMDAYLGDGVWISSDGFGVIAADSLRLRHCSFSYAFLCTGASALWAAVVFQACWFYPRRSNPAL